MGKPKDEVRRLLETLPRKTLRMRTSSTTSNVRQAILRGIEAADRGELVEQEEIERRMAKWLGK